ncbi:MAG: ATP-binding cassette domain-containing protein, partial [Alphaproteobacteria bacterium]
ARIKPGVSLVLGGDGAGKTTLLRLLAGALPAQSGSALLMGQPLQASDAARSSRVCSRICGTVKILCLMSSG